MARERASAKDANYVSVWFWLFAIIVAALPCVGTLVCLWFALVGANQTRKNYFRAVLILHCLVLLIQMALVALGAGPMIWEWLKTTTDRWPEWLRGS